MVIEVVNNCAPQTVIQSTGIFFAEDRAAVSVKNTQASVNSLSASFPSDFESTCFQGPAFPNRPVAFS